ncbi:glucuronyl esterase domain-containing protein [Horticoccus sp. 23ND18S-11]|uniref:glucuronyl esterase domain-containing protein n=1 Tax=Horticoccus sp. 23ND18S-11 TaxID=3391832 RepID=UPI0039C96B8D
MTLRSACFRSSCVLLLVAAACGAETPAARPKQDANGNPIRYAATGHVSNYDEAKVGAYTLPDPLRLQDGRRVADAAMWTTLRRPEVLKLYQDEIYGRVPATAPKASFDVIESGTSVLEGAATRKHVVVRFGDQADGRKANVVIYVPAKARGPVPVLFQLVFFGGLPSAVPPPAPSAAANTAAKTGGTRPTETGPVAEIIARGYAYATVRYTEFEGDRADTALTGVRRLALAAGQEKPASGEWGTVAAWAWGASLVMDYFATDRSLDAKRVGLIGHSRLGKTVLWASASDPRFAVVFSSCSGEMGASLARRDYGESVDDMAANFPWQFTGAFQKYAGRWNDLPVDAHLLIALSAPRPVFITGGTQDQWADPHGEFLAQVAAGPVYRLLGAKDLGAEKLPPLDMPLVAGDLGFHYHTGGHTMTAGDWEAFLAFAGRTLRPTVP